MHMHQAVSRNSSTIDTTTVVDGKGRQLATRRQCRSGVFWSRLKKLSIPKLPSKPDTNFIRPGQRSPHPNKCREHGDVTVAPIDERSPVP